MRFFIDTEFITHDGLIDLASIGVVTEDGTECYFELEVDWSKASTWVLENVKPTMKGFPITREWAKERLTRFVNFHSHGEKPEFWGDYCAYDYVAISQLMGTMEEWPEGWPFYFNDLQQYASTVSNYPVEYYSEHNALGDAKAIMATWKMLRGMERETAQGDMPEGIPF